MSNTKTEIDFEKIFKDFVANRVQMKYTIISKLDVFNCMKEAVKQARDIILREAAEKADIETMDQINFRVDKSSILNLANSEELNKKLGL